MLRSLANPAAVAVGPVQFDRPEWLLVLVVVLPLTIWIGRRSLSGLGGATRWVALVLRLIVLTILIGAIAEPSFRKESKDVSVTALLDASRSVPIELQNRVDAYLNEGVAEKPAEDAIGYITLAEDAYVQSLPSRLTREVDRQNIGAPNGTNLAAAVRLALATAMPDAGNRLLLASDGNETAGSLLQAARAAVAAGVPIDVLPLEYAYDNEVIFERLVAPATARQGETLGLRAVLHSTRPASGRLTILHNGQPIDLDPGGPGVGVPVQLAAGTNALPVPIVVPGTGPQEFEAVFEADPSAAGTARGDTLTENNRAMGVTFVSGEGRVLVVAQDTEEADPIVRALTSAGLAVQTLAPSSAPTSLTQWNAYDAVVLLNQSAFDYTEQQQLSLRQYVHDSGGGLVMVGGPDSFGAGGWIGSPLEDALPIKLDPPQKRQMPRGALAIIVHSVEMGQGVYYGKQVCIAAAQNLSRLDLFGILEYRMGGTDWVLPLRPVGDGSAARRAVNNLSFGDMPNYDPSFQLALNGLSKADAGQKHCIVISDGDPSGPANSLLAKFKQNGISVTAVGVATHSGADANRMRRIAETTGGRFYNINANQFSKLPNILIKEAQTIRRTLIWEGTPFSPQVTAGASVAMRGIGSVPPVSGYVVAADREGLSRVTLRGKENDPVLAEWQYGLGKAVAFTSDASTRWASAWVGSPLFRQFWEQHVRWVMRPGSSPNVRIFTEDRGEDTLVVVEAFDTDGERLPFADVVARLGAPDGSGRDVDLRQVGPGRWEATTRTDLPGSYVLSLRYRAPGDEPGSVVEGTAQAAVSRPYADEFRDLEDNTGLLRQVAEITGGRVLPPDPRRTELWSRDNVTMPVASTSMWLAMTVLGLGLFLADVAVRRVRIDLRAIGAACVGALQTSKSQAGAQMDALQRAREKAQAAMQDPATRTPHDMPEAGSRDPASAAPRDVAKRKFEATPEQLKKRSAGPGVLSGETETIEPARTPKTPAPKDAADQEGGMGRLLKAKRRAQDEMHDQGDRDAE